MDREGWLEQKCETVYVQHPDERMSQAQVIGVLNDYMDAGDTLVCAAGTAPGDLHQLFEATAGRILHLEFGNSCMGYDIPGAIGVRLARPDEGEVYVFLGDGNYMLHPMELKTAMQEETKLTIILLQNDGFQSIHGHQKVLVGHSLGNEFRVRNQERQANWTTVSSSRSTTPRTPRVSVLRAWNVSDESELKTALAEAKEERRSCMIVAQIERYSRLPRSGIWWDVFGAEVTEDEKTKQLVDEREEGRKGQRFYW